MSNNMSMTYGVLPDRTTFEVIYDKECGTKPFNLLNLPKNEWEHVANCCGYIDSHLEAVFFDEVEVDGKRGIGVKDGKSMHTLLRRLVETDNDDALNLCSSILSVLGFEWV